MNTVLARKIEEVPSFRTRQAIMRLSTSNAAAGGPLRLVQPAEDAPRLESLLKKEGESSSFRLATGLGLAEQGVPLRLPALLIPGLEILQRYHDLGLVPPRYLVYQATHFVAGANAIAKESALRISEIMVGYIDRFVMAAYPEIRSSVELRFAEQALVDDDLLAAVEQDVSDMPEAQNELRQLQAANARGQRNIRTAARYAAANVILNGAHPDSPFRDFFDGAPATMLIGGKQEDPFFRLTRLVAQQRGRVVIPQLCQPGEAPTYYPHSQGDIIIGDPAASREPAFAGARRDYELLRALGFPRDALCALSSI